MQKRHILLALFLLLLLPLSLYAGTKDYVLDPEVMRAFPSGGKKDGEMEQFGTDNYFTFHWSAKSKVDGSSKTWPDGYAGSMRVNLQGGISMDGTVKNAISFTTSMPNATVKVWWVEGGDDKRQLTVLNSKGETEFLSSADLAKNALGYTEFTLPSPGLHYLGSTPGNNYIFRLVVTDNEGFVAVPLVAPKEEKKEEVKVALPTIQETVDGRVWEFRTYGTSTSTEKNGVIGSLKNGSITLYSEGGKGKI
ncbi:MAG: hypothetical protein KBS81_09915, partial [Spirochaetales bacterium]|nr:hypothetical protein [Candidatus Physcosoma equi]